MEFDLKSIVEKFRVCGDYAAGQPYGSGHINDTFLVTCTQDDRLTRYVLQRINHHVFKQPIMLMNNMERVVNHIRQKLVADGVEDISRRVLTLIETDDGAVYHQDADGNVWRLQTFIEGAQTYDVLESLDQARLAARAFGHFQYQLADLPEPPLAETIPDFHNGPKRFQTFLEVLEKDPHNRAASVKAEIDYLTANAGIFDVFPRLMQSGEIPMRITHNDTKINNVMIDTDTGEAVCVIDLDTVMPGLALYDFGDIVRTTISTGAEDEVDLSRIEARIPRFEAIVEGYLAGAGSFLNRAEIDQMVHSGKMITLMIGTRFLTDYLDGDNYFKIHRDGHNLDRCRTQFKLVQSIAAQEEAMQQCVKRYAQEMS